MSNYRPLVIEIGKVVGISLVVSALFLLYMVFIGIPKTSARNWYNKAQLAEDYGDQQAAADFLQHAADAWPEGYILEELP